MGTMTCRRLALFMIAVFVIVLALSVAWMMFGKSELERKLELVEAGMTTDDVWAILGPKRNFSFPTFRKNANGRDEVGLQWRESNGAYATIWFDDNSVTGKDWTPSTETTFETLDRWMRRDE